MVGSYVPSPPVDPRAVKGRCAGLNAPLLLGCRGRAGDSSNSHHAQDHHAAHGRTGSSISSHHAQDHHAAHGRTGSSSSSHHAQDHHSGPCDKVVLG